MSDQVKILESRTFEYGILELRSDNILTFEPNIDIECLTITLIEQLHQQSLEITKEKPYPLYLNASRFTKGAEPEAKVYIKQHATLFIEACAAIHHSTLGTYLTNMFVYLYKPELPLKLFKTKTEAIAWLKSLQTFE